MPHSKKHHNLSGKPSTLLTGHLSRTTVIIVILLFVLVCSLLINIKFVLYGRFLSDPGLPRVPTDPNINPTKCAQHGYPPKSKYLIPYTVQKGDTLLSISKEKLGGASRINELINLNKDRYQQLSLQRPFLEVGWQLYLPPHYFPPSTGNVAEVQGVISAIDKAINPDSWEVQAVDPGTSSPSYLTDISKGTFISKPRQQYRVGDCITGFVFSDNSGGHETYLIFPQ